jgi:hypothetical protein
MISPGICDELKTIFTSFDLMICDTSGFQVTTAGLVVSARNAYAISESDVLMYRICLIWAPRPFIVMARSNRY